MASLLITNGHVVTDTKSFKSDILIVDGKIAALGKNLGKVNSHTRIIDATGLYLLPGGIDAHVHMELPVGGSIKLEKGSGRYLYRQLKTNG